MSQLLDVPRLVLVAEAKIIELLGESPTERYEASGVVVRDGVFYVVFDDMPHIGRIAGLTPGHALLERDGDRGSDLPK